jgi:hypothetical protein
LSGEYFQEFAEKFPNTLMGYSGAWGKLKLKISWHCPFNSGSIDSRKLYMMLPIGIAYSVNEYLNVDKEPGNKFMWKQCPIEPSIMGVPTGCQLAW